MCKGLLTDMTMATRHGASVEESSVMGTRVEVPVKLNERKVA